MTLTDEEVRRWPALAYLTAGHGRYTLALISYQEKYGEEALPETVVGDVVTRRGGEELAELLKDLDWIRQTVHRGNHDGPLDECKKNTCDAALKMLGKRE